jgi:hypothetical protein
MTPPNEHGTAIPDPFGNGYVGGLQVALEFAQRDLAAVEAAIEFLQEHDDDEDEEEEEEENADSRIPGVTGADEAALEDISFNADDMGAYNLSMRSYFRGKATALRMTVAHLERALRKYTGEESKP